MAPFWPWELHRELYGPQPKAKVVAGYIGSVLLVTLVLIMIWGA